MDFDQMEFLCERQNIFDKLDDTNGNMMFSFSPANPDFSEDLKPNTNESVQQIKQYAHRLIQQNLNLQTKLRNKDKQLKILNKMLEQKDLEIYQLKRIETQMKKSMENIQVYNHQYMLELTLKCKQLEALKKSRKSTVQNQSQQVTAIKQKYQISKDYSSFIKAKTSTSSVLGLEVMGNLGYNQDSKSKDRFLPKQKNSVMRPTSVSKQNPKRGQLLNQMRNYVTETQNRIRAQSKKKDIFLLD